MQEAEKYLQGNNFTYLGGCNCTTIVRKYTKNNHKIVLYKRAWRLYGYNRELIMGYYDNELTELKKILKNYELV